MASRQPVDLVVFDVDGTLHGIELWWPDLLRIGLRRCAEELGIRLATPDDRAALEVVGAEPEGVWSPFLPVEHQHRWGELRDRILPMELEVLRCGRDFLYPGVRDLLRSLRAAGCRTALASNCGQEYLDAVGEGQGLAELTDWQFCLDSPGVLCKADMLREAMERAATRRAVMVGDRPSDQAAAAAVGIPFIWRRNALCRLRDVAGEWGGEPAELHLLLGLGRIS
ncbi:MAG: HAD family hydrolase [Planctomycetes bacterium]|nr:HAD family hydrolase [Planctomycetota bacterium]